MGVVPVGNMSGSSSTYYSDMYWVSTAAGRVVYRGYFNAYAFGGVSYAIASYDASYSSAYVGSRLEIKESAYSTGAVSPRRSRGRRAAATVAARRHRLENHVSGGVW